MIPVVVAQVSDTESLVVRIVEELEAQPDARKLLLRALLTEEFLLMPDKLDQVQGEVADVKEGLAGVQGEVADVKEGLVGVQEDMAGVKEDMAGVRGEVAGVKEGLAVVQGEVAGMKEGLAGVQGEVAGMKEGLAGVQEAQIVTNRRLDRLEGKVGQLVGANQEWRVARDVSSVISQPLGLSATKVLKSMVEGTSRELLNLWKAP